MNDRTFLQACELVKSKLVGLDINRVFTSIGSNVFFEFGEVKELVFRNGKKSVQKEWSIWIGHASWRISKNGKYVVGSGDPSQTIQLNIQQLLGKRLKSFQFLSSFLDVQFDFDEGYQITTFFNWLEEDQWTLFLPDQSNISVDLANDEEIGIIRNLSKQVSIVQNYERLDLLQRDITLTGVTYDELQRLTLHLENGFSIYFQNCTWRLEKNDEYLIGCLDNYADQTNNMLSELIGKNLTQVAIANFNMDAMFDFEDTYVLRTFACNRETSQWTAFSKPQSIFQALIQLMEDLV